MSHTHTYSLFRSMIRNLLLQYIFAFQIFMSFGGSISATFAYLYYKASIHAISTVLTVISVPDDCFL